MAKKITVIEPVAKEQVAVIKPKKKVCAYCRVSTNTDEQQGSFTAQVDYYTMYIEQHKDWEFAGIFADEARSGTRVRKREEFQLMLEACKAGKIDLILTKSITRFARNTVDSIACIRELKSIGVAVYFEKEGIDTLTEKGELMMTILSSVAQGEVENISANSRWSVAKRFLDGSFIIGTPAYGYKNDENGNLVINEEAAPVVRRIFKEYLSGKGVYLIAKELEKDHVPTIRSSAKWSNHVVKGILQNKVYAGDMIYQKTYTTAALPFKHKVNHGELPQYFIEDNHPAIVSREDMQAAAEIFEYRCQKMKVDNTEKYNRRYIFSGRIVCRECGTVFRRQIINIGKTGEYIQWCCDKHITNIEECSTKSVKEKLIRKAFVRMWNKLYTNSGEVLEPFLTVMKRVSLNQEQEQKIAVHNNRIRDLMEQNHIMSRIAAKGIMDSALFMEKQMLLMAEITEEKRKRNFIRANGGWKKEILKTEQLISMINNRDKFMEDFEEEPFDIIIERIVIEPDRRITFCFYNGMELSECSE